MLQFDSLAGLPSYLQRSFYIPKHLGKHFKTDQVENAIFGLSLNAHRKQSFFVFHVLHCL